MISLCFFIPMNNIPDRYQGVEGVIEELERLYETEAAVAVEGKVPVHARLDDEELMAVVGRMRIRLAGFDFAIQPIEPDDDLDMLARLEASFTKWISSIQTAAAGGDGLDKDNLNPEMRRQMDFFHINGGHTSEYSPEQRRFLLERGLVALIELEVRKGVHVAVGALSGLSRNPWTDEGPLFEPFPQFDLRDLHIDPEEQGSLRELAGQSFLTCRSTVLPSTDHPLVREQLKMKREELPEELENQPLRRMGLAAHAKAVMLGIAQKFNDAGKQKSTNRPPTRFVTSNIATLFYGDSPDGFANMPSTKFNDWMRSVGWRKKFKMTLDERSRLRLRLQALMGPLFDGTKALIGPRGIASLKGHSIDLVEKEIRKWYDAIRHSIRIGDHADW